MSVIKSSYYHRNNITVIHFCYQTSTFYSLSKMIVETLGRMTLNYSMLNIYQDIKHHQCT